MHARKASGPTETEYFCLVLTSLGSTASPTLRDADGAVIVVTQQRVRAATLCVLGSGARLHSVLNTFSVQ